MRGRCVRTAQVKNEKCAAFQMTSYSGPFIASQIAVPSMQHADMAFSACPTSVRLAPSLGCLVKIALHDDGPV